MYIALNSGSNSPDSRSDRSIVLCSWAKHFTLVASLSIHNFFFRYRGILGQPDKMLETRPAMN